MKRIKTELPITIVTDDEYKQGDNLEMTRQRIEQAAFYVISLFNTVRYTLENLPDFQERKLEEAVWDARRTCELGYAIADTILASASCLTEFQPDDVAAEPETLANQISYLLNNPDLPTPIYNAVMQGVADIGNAQSNEILENFETSPEYLKAVFAKYKGDE